MRFSEVLAGAALSALGMSAFAKASKSFFVANTNRSITASSQAVTPTPYYDPTSGISYSSVTQANGVTFRVALPVEVTPSDAILQVIAPVTYGWCGFAWGGHMTNNPLSVSWPTGATSGQKSIVSSRMALYVPSHITSQPPSPNSH